MTPDIGTKFWKADPHQWGPGCIHLIHPDGTKTLCGVKLVNCPGQYVPAIEYDCRGCAKVLATKEQQQEREEQWRIQRQEWERQEQERRRELEERIESWRQKYNPQGKKFVPFGKYKGMPLEVMAQDRPYCAWLMDQEWFREQFQAIYSSIVDW